MILQQLTIHNIASIEDARINFEAQPLADSEVFLITGKTGAGKSTILDAICLALYANTPRLDNTNMQGDTKDQDKDIKIKDPVQLMRRNTGEAHATLLFTGSNGVHYEATWSVARARNKVTGKIQAKKWQLRNLDTDFTYNKDKEIREEIARAIGLDFKQFCRTTLLAQGEFTRFLNSKDDEKAEILEKITGVDAYSKIGVKIFEKTSAMRKIWEEAQQKTAGIALLSEEEKANKQAEIAALNPQIQEISEAIKKTTEARNWMHDAEMQTTQIKQQEQALQRLATNYQQLLGAQALEQAKQLEIEANIQQAEQTLVQEQQKLTEVQGEITNRQQQYEQQIQLIAQEQEAIQVQQLPSLRTQYDVLRDVLSSIASAKQMLSQLEEEKQRHTTAQQNLQTLLVSIQTKEKEAELLAPQIHDAETQKLAQQAVYEKQRESINKWAKSVRAKLQIGDICPVCQQKISTALPHEDMIDALVAEAEKMAKGADQKYQLLVAQKNKIDAEIKAQKVSYQKDSLALTQSEKSLEQLQARVKQALDKCSISNLLDIDVKEKESQANLSSLTEKIKQAEAIEKQIQAKRHQADLYLKETDKQRKAWQQGMERLQQRQQEIQQQKTLYNKYVVGNEHVASGISAILDIMPAWKAITLNPLQQKRMDNLLTRVSDLQRAATTALTQLKTSQENLAKSQKLLADFLAKEEMTEIAQLEASIAQLEASQKELSNKRGGILRDLEIDQANQQKIGNLKKEEEEKQAAYNKWDRLNQLLGDATGNKFRRIAQSYVLASLIHSANSYMRTLSDRYVLKVVPGTFVITLEDAYQGYVSRAASTLSGGESFLVSLSLALALSDIGNQLSVDTLFIDEGFGTLSGEPLQHAINTLRGLHTRSGRHVGIISHVEELKERIPVQIRVNQEGNNSSSTIEIVG